MPSTTWSSLKKIWALSKWPPRYCWNILKILWKRPMYPDYFFTCDYDVSQFWKNHQMTQIKVINYLQGLHIAISENTSNMMSVTPRKTLILGSHFSKFGCCRPTTFSKELHHSSFWSLANFFRIDKKTTLGQ